MKKTLKERFDEKWVEDENGCWLWTSTIHRDGYGKFWYLTGQEPAHRMSYEIYIGIIPEGLNVLHKCDNRRCVNPEHLFLGSCDDNSKDMCAKMRQNHGDDVHTAVLTEEDVIEVRARHARGNITFKDLAGQYGVCSSTMARAIQRVSWKHLP